MPELRAGFLDVFVVTRSDILLALIAGLLALLIPVLARAQDATGDSAETARLRLGPLGLTPRISLTNVGIDTNVLNQDVNPQRDFTMTFLPGVDSWLRVGRARLSGRSGAELVYFRKVGTQRSVGFSQQGRIALALNRVTPYFVADYMDSSRRPNAEIDARVRQTTKTLMAGVTLRVGWRAVVDLAARQQRLALEEEQFLGVNLAEALDRRTQRFAGDLRIQLTPLTTFVVKNSIQRDRFTFSSERDSDSIGVVPGLEFKPRALISGSAFVGYRHFRPRQTNQSVFSGVVAAVALSYLAGDSTRFNGKLDRDVDYSFEPAQPYFVSTGGNVSMTQALGGRWDVIVRGGRQRLDYRNLIGATPAVTPLRLDRIVIVGTGLGYRLGIDARIGFDINYGRRLSPLVNRRYSGVQFGGSFTYGS